ncbi:MAG: inositol monophosphatase [Candidatus Obscuribacterales bacterium]|nr:inositol monophosphatase [Candidatus Obscuribacterales bacterium]
MIDSDTINSRFQFAQSVILEAGAIAKEYFGRISALTIKNKGLHDLVSEADINTERFISQSLKQQFPDDLFFGEESAVESTSSVKEALSATNKRGIWVVDPIDGTQPFLNGIPSWCISMAYVFDNQIQFGVIYDATRNELFTGGLAHPATLNGNEIKPHAGRDFSQGLVSIGFSARTSVNFLFTATAKLLENQGMFFRNGSGALSLAYVACGRLMGHVEPHMHSWDCLGGLSIIKAAGGRINDFLVDDALIKGGWVVGATPSIYEQLLAMLPEHK